MNACFCCNSRCAIEGRCLGADDAACAALLAMQSQNRILSAQRIASDPYIGGKIKYDWPPFEPIPTEDEP